MKRIILPVLLSLVALAAGFGAGDALRPPPVTGEPFPEAEARTAPAQGATAFVRVGNQFVIPVMEAGRVGALVILSISLEVPENSTEAVFSREPRLRDTFLQVLFDHANAGGFRGTFTDAARMAALRRALMEAAVQVLGPAVTDVLVTDIVRQDS